MPDPITESALGLDLSTRVVASTTVVASPADDTETIIASLNLDDGPTIVSGVLVACSAAFTVGTAGVSGLLHVRQTDVAGTIVATSGAVPLTAADLANLAVLGFDAAPASGRVYVATLTVASGAAESTVAAVTLLAIAV
jgi:hypothetical protein